MFVRPLFKQIISQPFHFIGIIFLFIAALVLGSFFIKFLYHKDSVKAIPVLDVSESIAQKPLLGGKAEYTITIKNTGTTKGYNLSASAVFSSSRPDPEGRVTFSSAGDSKGDLPAGDTSTSSSTGDTTINFFNFKDLAPGETYSFNLEVDLSGDSTWQVGNEVINNLSFEVNTAPDGSGTTITGNASNTSDVLPISLVSKNKNQSTGVEQATGTLTRTYTYTIKVQNNYVNNTDSVVVTDTIPDGLEFLGVVSGPSPDGGFPTRDTNTGITNLQWSLGTMAPGQSVNITYTAGIRYDYFGLNNGGTNRAHDNFSGTPPVGTPIADKTSFANTVELNALYFGTPYSDSKVSHITAAYLTIQKGASLSVVGNGTVVSYTLTYYSSEYYNISDITVHDLIADGQTFNQDATPGHTSFSENIDGTTDIYWSPSILSNLPSTGSGTVTFSSTVDDNWEQVPISGEPIRAGDALSNSVDIVGTWNDEVDLSRIPQESTSSAGSDLVTATPTITKKVEDPSNPGNWLDSVEARVGDTLKFRIRFNTNDGSTAIRNDIIMGNITVTDWIPQGTTFNNDASITFSNSADFSDPSVDPPSLNFNGSPDVISSSSLTGLEWYLGDVAAGGWWEATFTISIPNNPSIYEGKVVNNLFKLTGINTFQSSYSDRDGVEITYVEPHLTLTKTATNIPTPLVPTSSVEYTLSINNTGHGVAEDVLIRDQLPVGMRNTTPSISSVTLNGTPLALNVDYKISYNSSTGIFYLDFNDEAAPQVETSLPAGSNLVIVYNLIIDSGLGAGASLRDIASVSYNSLDNGAGRKVDLTINISDDNTDDETITLPPLKVSKSVSPATPDPYTIGNTYTYFVDVTVPQGMVAYWPEINDRINRDGFTYVPGSASISALSGTPVIPAQFDATTNPDPIVSTAGTNRTDLKWLFQNYIDNSNQPTDYVFRITFNVLITGIEDNGSWEFFLPGNFDRVTNNAYIKWNTANTPSRRTNKSSNTSSVISNIDQPLLRTTKTVTSTGPYTSGSFVEYKVVIRNTGYSTAHDITWEDQLPVGLGGATLVSVQHSSLGNLTSPNQFQYNFSGNPLTINFDGTVSDTNLNRNETLTIKYKVQVDTNIGAGANLTNIADSDWSTQNGSQPDERIFNDSSKESSYTNDTSSASINIIDAFFDKTITSPTPSEATIGDIISYKLTITVPVETVLYLPKIIDTISTDGMKYVSGSASINNISGNPETTATLNGSPIEDYSPLNGASITYNFNSPIDNANSSSPTGDTNYVFELSYNMVVTGLDDSNNWIWNPNSSHLTHNTAELTWNDGSNNHSKSDSADLTILQPYLETDKSFDVHTGIGGDTVHVTVTITNQGDSTAFEFDNGFDFIDNVPEGFINPTLTSVSHSANGTLNSPVDYSVTISGNDLQIEYNSSQTDLSPSEILTIKYTLQLDPSIGSGAELINYANANYSSLSNLISDERQYNDSDSLEGTLDEDEDTLIVPSATITKTADHGGSATIGDIFNYTITASIPSNTTIFNAYISDTIPDGLTVVNTNQSPNVGSVSFSYMNGETDITWNVGDISNPPTNQLILTITVRVDNTYYDSSLLDGLPSGIDGDIQDSLVNEGSLFWYTQDVGGDFKFDSDTNYFTVIEPHLTISKDSSTDEAGPTDNVDYTVIIANNGTSTAYDIDWEDLIPSELFNSGTSPTLLSIEHTTEGILNSPSDFTYNFNTNPITATFDNSIKLDSSESLTITYRVNVENNVNYGDVLTNTSKVNHYSSQSGTDPNERTSGPVSTTQDLIVKSPALITQKDVLGDNTPQRGNTIIYQYSVTNVGNHKAINVDVSDILPSTDFSYVNGSTSASWPSGSSTGDPSGTPGPNLNWDFNASLDPSETLTLTFEVKVESSASLETHINTSHAVGENLGGNPIPADSGAPADSDLDDSDTASVLITNPKIAINKEIALGQDQYVQIGDDIIYNIKITNTGDTVITHLPLSDLYDTSYLTYQNSTPVSDNNDNDGQIDWSDLTSHFGNLSPSASFTITARFKAASARLNVSNLAIASGAIDENNDYPPSVNDSDTLVSITNPAILIEKILSSTPNPTTIGSNVSFDLTITNNGDTVIDILPLEDTYNLGFLTYQNSSIASDDNNNDGTINWTDLTITEGNLNPGSSMSLTLNFIAISTGNTINTAAVNSSLDIYGDYPSPTSDFDDTLIVTNPDLSLDKTLASGQDPFVALGNTVTYDIVITNTGDTIIEFLPLEDTYPNNYLSFQSATISPNDSNNDGTLNWDDLTNSLGDLSPGNSTSLSLTFEVIAPHDNIENTATIENALDEHGNSPDKIQDTDNVLTGTNPEILISKTLISGQDQHVQVGEEVSYKVTITNIGTTTVVNLPLEDTYDISQLSFVSADTSTDDSNDDGVLNWTDLTSTLGDLTPGNSLSVIIHFTAQKVDELIPNTAIAKNAIDEYDDTLEEVTDTDNILTVTNPSLAINKELNPGQSSQISVGNNVTYKITITNDGDTRIDELPLSDTFDINELSFISSEPAISSQNGGTLIWDDLIQNFDNLEPNKNISVTVTFKTLIAKENVINLASVENAKDLYDDTPQKVEDNDSILVVFDPSKFIFEKLSDPIAETVVLPFDILTYSLHYKNGTLIDFTDITLTDDIENSVEYVPNTLSLNGSPLTDVSDSDPAQIDLKANQINVHFDKLPKNTEGMITYQAKVLDLTFSQKGVINQALFKSKELGIVESNTIFHPVDPINITKASEDLNGGKLEPGDEIKWTIVIQNIGLTKTTHVIITDKVPDTVTYVPYSIRGRGADDSHTPDLVWNVGVLEINEKAEVSFVTKVKLNIPSQTKILNQATVYSDQSFPKSSDNPNTPELSDPTSILVETGLNLILPLSLSIFTIILGIIFLKKGKKINISKPSTSKKSKKLIKKKQ
jgi:fimbrial isopeptide formation D2 family protein/uncharacterized repeat protein (TIGR01451 family)